MAWRGAASDCLPHARGGVSVSSTRTASRSPVFPTHVGVFLGLSTHLTRRSCLPHARGGVSCPGIAEGSAGLSSPRTWGCFPPGAWCRWCGAVFPTHVGVFPSKGRPRNPPIRLPHARGGVSRPRKTGPGPPKSSPRTWGCFFGDSCTLSVDFVFPTHVGVFLDDSRRPLAQPSLPHARGGVSAAASKADATRRSSPRTWGCFPGRKAASSFAEVFPTHVGVFPKRSFS